MTRAEHLQWAKDRALAYHQAGDDQSAVASMFSDLGKHDALGCPIALAQLAMMHLMNGNRPEIKRWIEGFN